MTGSQTVAERIRSKLQQELHPLEMSVIDDSAQHAGHAGARPGRETHFSIRIISPDFSGLSRVDRQRRVYALLADEIRDGVHALGLTTLTPDEARS